jgi:hypothetical protein
MANLRLPVAKAEATGAAIKNPQRHRERKAPPNRSLGAASSFLLEKGEDEQPLVPMAHESWEAFKRELPWLTEGHRAFMEMTVVYRAKMLSGQLLNTTEARTYQAMLSKLGASPADESKVNFGDEGGDPDPMFDA